MTTFVNVDDFSGTDQSRIDQAMAMISSTGGTIIFPKRIYTIENITLLSNVSIIGNGSTITRDTDLNGPLVEIGEGKTNINISGFIFNGNKNTQTGNNAAGIICRSKNQDVTITHCVFDDILRTSILIVDGCRFHISDVSFNNGGRTAVVNGITQDWQGISIAIYDSKDIIVENASTLLYLGEGMSVSNSQGVIFRNHSYTRPNPPIAKGDNAITFTQCSDFVLENIEASYMQNQGIELNICDRFKLSNLDLHHNGSNNLMISVVTPGDSTAEVPSTYGEVSNVISRDAGSSVGVNIIGSHHINFNNIIDNTCARFAPSGRVPALLTKDIEVRNSTFHTLQLESVRNIRLLNNTQDTMLISNTTYSMTDTQNKFDTYFQADLNHNGTIDVNIPETALAGTTFFHGVLEVDNMFTPSASLQFTSKLVHVKLVWDKFRWNIISTLNGEVTGRDFDFTGGSNKITLRNISGVPTTMRGRLTGTTALY